MIPLMIITVALVLVSRKQEYGMDRCKTKSLTNSTSKLHECYAKAPATITNDCMERCRKPECEQIIIETHQIKKSQSKAEKEEKIRKAQDDKTTATTMGNYSMVTIYLHQDNEINVEHIAQMSASELFAFICGTASLWLGFCFYDFLFIVLKRSKSIVSYPKKAWGILIVGMLAMTSKLSLGNAFKHNGT